MANQKDPMTDRKGQQSPQMDKGQMDKGQERHKPGQQDQAAPKAGNKQQQGGDQSRDQQR